MTMLRHRRLAHAATLALFFTAVVAAYTWWDNQRIVVRHYTVIHPQVPPSFNGYRVVFISDLEGRTFGARQRRLIDLIVAQDPDLIILGGDYIHEEVPSLDPLTDLVKGLRAELNVPIYFVLGDKDWFMESNFGDATVLRALTELGAHYLNGPVRIEKESDYVWLAGLRFAFVANPDDLSEYLKEHPDLPWYEKDSVERGTEFWRLSKPSDFVIVVDHKPLPNFRQYLADVQQLLTQHSAEQGGASGTYTDHDLYLAGHTHGGQIRLPLIGPLVHPNRGFFPGNEYVKGVFVDEDGRYQVVGAGLGASGPRWARFRFLNPPEIVLITLQRGERTR